MENIRKKQRRRTECAENRPERGNDEKSVSKPQVLLPHAHGIPYDEPGRNRQAEALHKWQPGAVPVEKTDQNRRQHRHAEHHQQQTEDPLHDRPVHVFAIRLRSSVPVR